jgi:hypothetical protein
VSDTEPMPRQPYHRHGPGPGPGGPPPGPAYRQGPPPGPPGPEYGPGYGSGYGGGQAPPPAPAPRRERRPRGEGAQRAALIIHTIADIAAVILGLWILLYLLEANQANPFVEFVRGSADWLAAWAQDIFTMENEGLRVFFNYGLPALIYLLIGHGISARVRRL